MFQCQLTDSFNRCQYRSCINGDLYCTAKYAGCGFRMEIKSPDPEGPGIEYSLTEGPPQHRAADVLPAPYVRKPRWYESYYPDSRPVK